MPSPRLSRALLCVLLLTLGSLPRVEAVEPSSVGTLVQAMADAEQSLQQGELQLADSHYRTALLEGWLLRGALAVGAGDLEAALRAFERAGGAAIETRRALLWQSRIHLQLNQPVPAIAMLTQLTSKYQEDISARRLLAEALIADSRYKEAVQELEEAHARAPEDAEITYTLANGYLRVGKPEEAQELYDQVARERPIPQTHLLIGRSFGSFRHFDRAQAAFEAALAMDPEVRRGHYYLGTVKLLASGRDGLEPAIQHFGQARLLTPEDPMVNLYLGTAMLATRRFEEAVPALEVASSADHIRVDALRFLGGSYLGLDRPRDAARVLKEALAASETLGGKDRQLAAVHYQLGLALRRSGAGDEATGHFEAAEIYSQNQVADERDSLTRFLSDNLEDEQQPAKPSLTLPWIEQQTSEQRAELERRVTGALARAYLNLGILHLQAERPARAALLIAQASEVDGSFPGVQSALGTAYFNAGQFEQANAPLALARKQDPANVGLRRMAALAHFNTDSFRRAADLLEDDGERATNPALELTYGLALMRSGRADEAQPVFDRLLARNAEWPELHVALGQAHAQRGDFDAAIGSLERALELAPNVAQARATLGELYLRQGRLDDAEQQLRGELETHPTDHTSRYHLATVLDLNRQSDEARQQLETLLDARPNSADARYLLGKILLAEGEAEAAAGHLEAAAALNPEDPTIFNQLGQAYQRLGRRELAQQQFEIFRQLKQQERGSG
ncbi:MAG: tetratricopeptide repeat protein, partial [Acidobacteriota bacterium]